MSTNEPTRSPAPEKPDGWYHSKDKRAKFVHFFRGNCGKPMCGRRARKDKRAAYPLPESSTYEACPDCLEWYRNLHKPKEHTEGLAKV